MSDAFLTCRDVVKRFQAVEAVAGANLSVTKGEVLALLGPSGCGKTTLLRVMAGFETPEEGEIELDGHLLNGPGTFVAPEKRRISLVFQDFALFPHLSVAANVAFGLPKGADKKRRVAELLDLVGLQGMENRMPSQLSGGQQQRVALARALAAEPKMILLDEPFSNLDPSIRERVRIEVKQLIQQVGITAIFVTHDQEEALSLAEQVAVMIEGRILQVGTPLEVYTRPVNRLVGEFVGGANFLRGLVANATVDFELGRLPVKADFAGAADVMVRAESLTVADEGGVPGDVVGVEYYGHDQMVILRLASGSLLKVRLPAGIHLTVGQRVGAKVKGEVFAFPARDS
jgi:iron(III) transport system ATP-binding protein